MTRPAPHPDFALTDRVIVFTSVCDEDAHHVDRYLWEIQRLEVMFCVHFDRCSERTKQRFFWSRNLFGFTEQDDRSIEFTEQHKQSVFDLAATSGRPWAMALDIDETLERDAVSKLLDLPTHADLFDVQWLNLWGDKYSIRSDGAWLQGHRANIYNVSGGRKWRFDHPITNGAKLDTHGRDPLILVRYPLVVLHWGAIRPEWRQLRKARWDRVYGAAVGNNPYGHWRAELDETGLETIENTYLP